MAAGMPRATKSSLPFVLIVDDGAPVLSQRPSADNLSNETVVFRTRNGPVSATKQREISRTVRHGGRSQRPGAGRIKLRRPRRQSAKRKSIGWRPDGGVRRCHTRRPGGGLRLAARDGGRRGLLAATHWTAERDGKWSTTISLMPQLLAAGDALWVDCEWTGIGRIVAVAGGRRLAGHELPHGRRQRVTDRCHR